MILAWVVVSQTSASATTSRYLDGPRNEWGVAVEAGVHAWTVDSAAHPFKDTVWVKPDGGPAYRVSALTSDALLGNIDLANPTFGDVLVFESSGNLGRRQIDVRIWDLANREALTTPAGIDTPTADEESPSISGDRLVFLRVYASGAARVILYRLGAQTFTSVALRRPRQQATINSARVAGDYVVYDVCAVGGVCNVFRYRISTATTVEAPNPGRANYWPTVMADGTVYFVQGSARECGHVTNLMRWTGSGSPTLLAALPEKVDAAAMDAHDDGTSTTLYFTRIRCASGFRTGIYQVPNV